MRLSRVALNMLYLSLMLTLCMSVASGQDTADLLLPSLTLSGHSSNINIALFSPDGQTILTGSYDNTAILWDAKTGERLHTLAGHTEGLFEGMLYKGIIDAAFSPDGKVVITSGYDHDAILWDAKTGKQLYTLGGHREIIFAVAFSPDGTRAATASLDRRATVWDVETGQRLFILSGHAGRVNDIAFSPDGQTILTGSSDANGRLWDARTGRRLHTLVTGEMGVNTVAFSPDGKMAITASNDTTTIFWDVVTGEKRSPLPQGGGNFTAVYEIAPSPDGKLIYTAGRYDSILWDIEAESILYRFTHHTNRIQDVAFSPNGKMVLSGGDDGTAVLTDVQTGNILRIFAPDNSRIDAVAFSPDSRTVLLSGWQTATLWDISDIYASNEP